MNFVPKFRKGSGAKIKLSPSPPIPSCPHSEIIQKYGILENELVDILKHNKIIALSTSTPTSEDEEIKETSNTAFILDNSRTSFEDISLRPQMNISQRQISINIPKMPVPVMEQYTIMQELYSLQKTDTLYIHFS